MNDLERYIFDLNGYLVIENVIEPEEVKAMCDTLDKYDYRAKDNKSILWFDNGYLEFSEDYFRKLIDHPKLLPYLTEILGEYYRLDHEYGVSALPGAPCLDLHGGGTPFDPAQYYLVRNNRIFCGLTVVYFALTDLNLGEGGFCCLPGSHKSNYSVPESFVNFEDSRFVVQVPLKAGSVLIFTEALTHGTLPYRSKHERKGLLFKYSPANSSFAVPRRSDKLKSMLSGDQLARIELPFVVNRKRFLRATRRIGNKTDS